LKKIAPIILLRNVSAFYGLCNGTPFIVRNMFQHIIEAEIAVGSRAGEVVYIAKMPIIPSEPNIPFDLNRYQVRILLLTYFIFVTDNYMLPCLA